MDFSLTEEHKMIQQAARDFAQNELLPGVIERDENQTFPTEQVKKMGELGFMGMMVDPKYGGSGLDTISYVLAMEEISKVDASASVVMSVNNSLVCWGLQTFGTEEQKLHWLPKMVRGEVIGALGLTEPHVGSDLRNIRTSAVRDGDEYVISGQKTFISNGQLCDVVVLATKTDSNAKEGGISLFIVESSRTGFVKGRRLEKIGLKAQDTSELFFEEMRVPVSNLLGPEHGGFKLLMKNLAQERLTQAVRSAVVVETVIDYTVAYATERKMFGQTLADFQNTQFKLAEMKTEAVVARVFVDHCLKLFMARELSGTEAAMAKMTLSNLHCRVVDECLQLFGGWGYMWEYPIARAYADARVVRIAGGSIEVMKQIIGRSLFPIDKSTQN